MNQNFWTDNELNKSIKWAHIVVLASTNKGRDSSSNDRLRRFNESVTVNLTRIEQ